MSLHPVLERVTARVIERSAPSRRRYLDRMAAAKSQGPARAHLSCSGQAHAFAAAGPDQGRLAQASVGNLGIVTAYNDMLSAHQPFEHYPTLIRDAVRALVAQRKLQAVSRRCVMASRKAKQAWS